MNQHKERCEFCGGIKEQPEDYKHGHKYYMCKSSFHTMNSVNRGMWERQPRRYGKSTFVDDAFIASCEAGKAVVYHHPKYVVLSRKAYANMESLLGGKKKKSRKDDFFFIFAPHIGLSDEQKKEEKK